MPFSPDLARSVHLVFFCFRRLISIHHTLHSRLTPFYPRLLLADALPVAPKFTAQKGYATGG
jgi:hypothetical protein